MRVNKTASHPSGRVIVLAALFAALLLASMLSVARASAAGTCPNEAIREEQGSTYLPDCRGYELVSPVLKNGAEVEPAPVVAGQVPFQASVEGPAVAYLAQGGFPGSASAGLYTQYLALGGPLGSPWQNISLNPEPNNTVIEGSGPRTLGEFVYYSPNLSCGIEATELPQVAQLPPEETAQDGVRNLYQWNAADASYTLITNVKPENLTHVEQGLPSVNSVDGASADCGKVIFESANQFDKAPAGSLYEWNGERLEVASKLPDATNATAVSPVVGGEVGSNFNEISSDGSKVFFTATADAGIDAGKREVFLRENGTHTIEASAAQSEPAVQDTGARFQAASRNGSRVFFTANYGLTKTTSVGKEAPKECQLGTGSGCDLYEYNAEKGSLTDLSADIEATTGDTTGANVRGVLGISEDGSYVYFSASGQLVAAEGNKQVENETNKQANVYVYHEGLHPESSLSYVSTIGAVEAGMAEERVSPSKEVDALVSSSTGTHGLSFLVSRVSAAGNYLLFATTNKVKEYDGEEYNNEDQNVAMRFDWEEYEYSLASGKVTCVSCNPKRSVRPAEFAGTEAFGALGPFTEVRDGAIPRNLSNDGRVFFDSFAPLVSQVRNKTINAYDWAPEGLGSCPSGTPAGCLGILDNGADSDPSYVEGASADGEHVYVTSKVRLAPQDEDGLRDIYDVRVGGGIAAPPASKRCEEEECQGTFTSTLSSSIHASESGIGGGNPASPPATNGVQGFRAGSVKIKRHSTKGSTLTLVVSASGGGRITASGSGLGTVRKSISKAGSYTLKISLTAKAKAAVRRKKRLKVRVHVAFAPSSERSSSTTVTVTFT